MRRILCAILALTILLFTGSSVAEDHAKQLSLADIAISDALSLADATEMTLWKLGSDNGIRTLDKNKMDEFLTQFDQQFSITETGDNVLIFDGFSRADTYEINFLGKGILGSVYIQNGLIARYGSYFSSLPNFKYKINADSESVTKLLDAYYDQGKAIRTEDTKDSAYTIGNSDIPIPMAEENADVLNKLGLFQGTDNGYELEKPVTRAEAITMVLRMIGEEKDAAGSNSGRDFSDVASSHWAYANIGYAAGKGYINGTSETTFDPERTVTGREFVKMLLSAFGYQGITIEDAYDAGIKYALLVNNYTKLAVSAEDYPLLRNDVVNLCYCALLARTPDGRSLKDKLIEKGVVDEQRLNSLILAECSDTGEGFAWGLNRLMPVSKNYMFSPLSIKMALAIASVGANGETKDEILNTLQIDDLDSFNQACAQLIEEYSGNEKVKLNIANSLWLNTDYYKDVDFKSAFADTIQKYYHADSEKVNNTNAVRMVNDWVKNKTNGKISQIISSSDFLACIVNAVYFKGEWAKQFSKGATQKAEFTDRDGKKSEIDFMNMTDYFGYYADDSVQMIKLPYKDGKTSMYVALTAGRAMALDASIEKMEAKRVKLSLPKFKTEFGITLNSILSNMGIRAAFDDNKADFTAMFTDTPNNVCITEVSHKTFIDVDENGTEAAAATAIAIRATSVLPEEPPVEFAADKPFTYFIRDDANGEILFMGEYAYAD